MPQRADAILMQSAPTDEDEEDEAVAGEVSTAIKYYYADTGQPPKGPCTVNELKVLWMGGYINGATSLWREGMARWIAVNEVPEVAATLKRVQQPPAADTSNLWYYLDADTKKQRGGVTAAQMGVLLQRGEVDGLSLVWRQGMAAWTELGSVDELRTQLQRLGDDAEEDDHAEEEEERRLAMLRAQQQVAYDPDAEVFVPRPLDVAVRGAVGDGGAVVGACGNAAGSVDASAAAAGAAEGVAVVPGSDGGKRKRKKKGFVAKAGSNVYVSGLPSDVTMAEVAECLKVAGVIKTDAATGEPRIKLYRLSDGSLKGDALVSFIKPESVQLAVTLRDGFPLRDGVTLSVQPAKFEKREDGGQRLGKDEALARKKQRMIDQRALADWDAGLSSGRRNSTVVLTGLFDAAEVAAEASAEGDARAWEAAFYSNLRQDVEVECRKAGAVEKVTLFEGSERGAVAVRFKDADDAERCAAMLDDRTFGQRTVRCAIYDGVTDYRALNRRGGSAEPRGSSGSSGAAGLVVEGADGPAAVNAEDVVEQERNLDAFADWLEAASTDSEAEEEPE